MHPQHNPIAQRIDEMRRVWQQRVKLDTVLVRWLLKPDESRMYEGFCRLEASPHGRLDELFVFFYTPFEDAAAYSRDIIANWLHEIKTDTEQKERVQRAGIPVHQWDYATYERLLQEGQNVNYDQLLIDLMASYRQLLPQKNVPLVLSLLPQKTASVNGFAAWLKNLMRQNIPPHLRLLLFDHAGGNYWGSVFDACSARAVTLRHDLRLDEAVRQIATGGDSQSPDVQFRKCMYEMGDAAQERNVNRLHQWGKKAIEIGTKSGNKNLLATAYITYAGMLFTFKDYVTVHALLDSGMRICKQAIASGDETMKPLLLQFYGFKGAACQQQKETQKALEWFMKGGQEAAAYGLFAQSVSAYYKAFLLAQYKRLTAAETAALTGALANTPHLREEEIKSSEYPYAAYEYAERAKHKMPGTDPETATAADEKMKRVYGADWKATVQKLIQNFDKQQVRMAEAKASAVSG